MITSFPMLNHPHLHTLPGIQLGTNNPCTNGPQSPCAGARTRNWSKAALHGSPLCLAQSIALPMSSRSTPFRERCPTSLVSQALGACASARRASSGRRPSTHLSLLARLSPWVSATRWATGLGALASLRKGPWPGVQTR